MFGIRVLGISMLLVLAVAAGCGPGGGAGQSAAPEQSEANVATPGELPEDVYADSRNRLPLAQREELDEDGQRLFDAVAADTRSLAGFQGPQGIRIYSPQVAVPLSAANRYLRFEAGLDPRLRELAILMAARSMDQQFEWTAHELTARKEGLPQEIIDVVKHRRPLSDLGEDVLGEKETAIIRLGREVFDQHQVSPETFANALRLFGERDLVNITSLMGQYAATAVLLTTFDQHVREGQEPLLPLP